MCSDVGCEQILDVFVVFLDYVAFVLLFVQFIGGHVARFVASLLFTIFVRLDVF